MVKKPELGSAEWRTYVWAHDQTSNDLKFHLLMGRTSKLERKYLLHEFKMRFKVSYTEWIKGKSARAELLKVVEKRLKI